MSDVIDSRNSANGSPCRKEIVRDLHHGGEALGGQLTQAGEETTLGRVDVDPDGEERVHEEHPAVQVDSDQRHPLQAGERDLPPTLDALGRSGSPGPSAPPVCGPSHPRGRFENVPRGLRQARAGLPWSQEPPPPTVVAAGGTGRL